MKLAAKINRRTFLITSALASGGLAIGLRFPGLVSQAEAAEPNAEVGVWVLIQPDDSVVVRIARSEMGQGTLTGLAQLVAEELECDWAKVTTEFPSPGESARRGRPWPDRLPPFYSHRQSCGLPSGEHSELLSTAISMPRKPDLETAELRPNAWASPS